MALSMEWSEEGSKARRPLAQFPEFSHSYVGYKFEPVNLNRPNKKDRKKK